MAELPEVDHLERWKEGLCTDEKIEVCDELIEKRRRIDEHDASIVQEMIERLDRVNYIVESNHSELISTIEEFEEDDTIMSSERNDEFNRLVMEFLRTFSNFVGSAKNREYHTERIISRLEDIEDSESTLEKEYEEKVSEFDVDLHGVFFTSLRNIFVHEQALKPSGTEHMETTDEGVEIDRTIVIKKRYILDNSDVPTKAMGYMDILDDKINVKESIDLYYQSLKSLYEWLSDHIIDRYQHLFEDRKRLVDEAEVLYDDFLDEG